MNALLSVARAAFAILNFFIFLALPSPVSQWRPPLQEDWRTGQARTRKTAGNYTEVPKGANIFYEAPVIAAKVALSPFLSVWSALDSWLSAGARRVLSGGHQDSPGAGQMRALTPRPRPRPTQDASLDRSVNQYRCR